MKLSHITVRANVAYGEYQHARVEVRMEPDKSDTGRTAKDMRLEVADFVEECIQTVIFKLKRIPVTQAAVATQLEQEDQIPMTYSQNSAAPP